jgi:hypothetical protein
MIPKLKLASIGTTGQMSRVLLVFTSVDEKAGYTLELDQRAHENLLGQLIIAGDRCWPLATTRPPTNK